MSKRARSATQASSAGSTLRAVGLTKWRWNTSNAFTCTSPRRARETKRSDVVLRRDADWAALAASLPYGIPRAGNRRGKQRIVVHDTQQHHLAVRDRRRLAEVVCLPETAETGTRAPPTPTVATCPRRCRLAVAGTVHLRGLHDPHPESHRLAPSFKHKHPASMWFLVARPMRTA